jgi:cytochrome c biogenesis protein
LENFSNNFQGFGPTAQMVKLINNKPVKAFYIFKKYPNFDLKNRNGKYVLYLKDATFKYYTGLEVTKDPGVNVVWLGCFLMIIGLYISFFLNHKKFWIKVSQKDKTVNILFAGSMRKNRISFEQEFKNKFEKLKNYLEVK